MAPSQKRRKNMERELFYEKMKEALMELKPDEMEITFMRVDKQNRMGLHGCTLSMPDAAAAPTFYLEELYEAYLNGTAVEDIAEGVIEFAKENNRAVIPNGIDAARFHPLPGGAERGTHDGDRGNPPVEILFVSRLEPDCSLGAELLLEAAIELAKKEDAPPFRVTIAGQGSMFSSLAALAGRVNFLVGRPLARAVRPNGEKDLIGLYRRAEIFVGVSRAAMEASFCGCAVLLCGNEGYGGLLSPERRELAAGNFTCRGLPLPTGRGLTRDLLFLLQNPALRRANAEKTGEWMRQNFGAEGVCRAVEQVYRRRLWLAGKGDFPT